ELAYRLASDDSPATREMLRNTVLVLVPSVNPDGIDIVTNWYRKTLGTPYEGTSPPVLYHRYTGHDNNRDWFMLTQVETQIVTNSTYDTWWHGGLRTAPYYHNAVGILTEAASANIATPMQIKREQLRSPTRGLADPLVAATNYPDPWPGGAWAMRDIMNMELV